jgi:hypothetical protein
MGKRSTLMRPTASPVSLVTEAWKMQWQGFFEAFQGRQRRLLNEVTSAWGDMSALLHFAREAFIAWPARASHAESFEVVSDQVRQAGRDLLDAPLDQYQRRRPVRRVLSAIEDCGSAVEELVRHLPHSLPYSGNSFLDSVGISRDPSWTDSLISWRSLGRDLPLRGLVKDHLHREAWRRSRLDDSFLRLLMRACLELREPWHIYRSQILRTFAGVEFEPHGMAAEWNLWQQRTGDIDREGTRLLDRYERWVDNVPSRLAQAIQRASWRSGSERSWSSKVYEWRSQRNLSRWSEEQRAVTAVLDLELGLRRLGSEAAQITARSLSSLRLEHADLKRTLAGMLSQLNAWSASALELDPRELVARLADTRLLSLDERVDRWSEELSQAGSTCLPERLKARGQPQRPLLWRISSSSVEPRKVFSFAVQNFGKPILRGGLAEVTETNGLIAREMEHARQVVEYGWECAGTHDGLESDLLAEAVANARGLLEEQSRPQVNLHSLDRVGVKSLMAVFQETYSTLEVGRVGLLAHLRRLQGQRAVTQLTEYAVRGVQTTSRRWWESAKGFFDSLLLRIGWRLPARPLLPPVIQRVGLTQVMEVKQVGRDLPPIYRHLFRLDPVENPRFMVGRDEELKAFGRALQQWDSGQFAAILLVGDRGSGKTSLLNCARCSVFADHKVVAGNFSQRLTDPKHLQSFLRELFQVPESVDLVSALAEGRRVVILEEFERTFLRTVNGFEAIRYLLQLIHPTADSTLWILALNDRSFRYLDVAVDLGRFFSHRINAMSVKPKDLEKAILQRHNLSGLRLKFAPPLPEDPRVSRLRNWLGLQLDSQRLFFDALYEQSGGVFRSAFELWQGCIEQVEAGAVEMRQPLGPNYSSLRDELVQMDHFTLVAVLQHGSLTEWEIAQVFCECVETSRVRLGRLQALQILEQDPLHPGLRVRPEARHFVLETLHRVNLA